MAQGDLTIFQEYLGSLGLAEFNLNTDTYKLGIVTSTNAPITGDADPGWSASRSTDFSATQVTPGGNYADGGPDITNTYSEAGGTATFDGADITILQNASNPTNARWGIIYNDTDSDKKAMLFVDLGSDFNMTTGDLVFTWNASGLKTIS